MVSQLPGLAILCLFSSLLPISSWSASAGQSYVVYMGSHSGEMEPEGVYARHHQLLASVVGSEDSAREALLYSYKHSINGFAAILDPYHVSTLASMPEVISVFPNRAHSLHTTRSWEFLDLEKPSGEVSKNSLWTKAEYGKDVIVGVFDTGIWPESESFRDAGLGPVPARWKGTCESGSNFTSANCNRKLIGARYFLKGYEAGNGGPLNESATGDFRSARDKEGHGSHTASTAAGNFVKGANEFGFATGTAKGGAPMARLAAYKVCWPGGCYDADIMAAFDAAIADGVDVFSLSLGSGPPLADYFTDAIAVGSLHAVSQGRIVVCSAGNDGPAVSSVSNVAPWIFTIAASSIDRQFPAVAYLGNNKHYTGASLSEFKLPKGMYPLVASSEVTAAGANATAGELCFPGSLDPEKARGKIVACKRGVSPRVQKGSVVKEAGGVGLVLCNQPSDAEEVVSDPHVLPATHLTAGQSLSLLSYINQSGSSATAYIGYPRTVLDAKPAPQMASFSSQGPNSLTPDILKPDITAPGLNILAAWTQASAPTADDDDHRVVRYNVISGTSMSCPHAAGVVALLRALHPSWTPAAIKSAVMTTASRHDNSLRPIVNGSSLKASPFNYGAGHVSPNRAADPGLVYDTTASDYGLFLCSLRYNRSALANLTRDPSFACPARPPPVSDLNYPSITLSRLAGPATVARTVTYVGGGPTYRASVAPPPGVHVEVVPSTLAFSALGERKSFQVHLRPSGSSQAQAGTYVFGYLTWTDDGGAHRVTSPITVNATVGRQPHT